MALVGPGAVQNNTVVQGATLDGASEYEYVTILNPLPDDFVIAVAQDIPVNIPFEIPDKYKTTMVQNENDIRQNYGLNLKNPEFKSRKHIINNTIIFAGKTKNLKGSEAQVAVRQLVNEILQREGKKRLLADPNLRREVEDRIIVHRGSMQELMDDGLNTVRKQMDEAINTSNEVLNEEAFPGLREKVSTAGGSSEANTGNPTGDSQIQPKRLGRPKKADS